MSELVTKKLRPGDIYTHVYSGLRDEQDASGAVNPALWEARKRGVIFDVGHGGGSFLWRIAMPAMKAGFLPDSISTDLHIGSMNAGMKDMLNVMDKFLAMGLSLDEVMLRSTWNPAKEIRREELGHLSPGAVADIGVFRLEKGSFGFVDMYGARLKGTQKLVGRADAARRPGRLRSQRDHAARLEHAAEGLPPDRRRALGCRHARAGPPQSRRPSQMLSPNQSGTSAFRSRHSTFYSASLIGRIQIFRKRTGLPWSCRPMKPLAFVGGVGPDLLVHGRAPELVGGVHDDAVVEHGDDRRLLERGPVELRSRGTRCRRTATRPAGATRSPSAGSGRTSPTPGRPHTTCSCSCRAPGSRRRRSGRRRCCRAPGCCPSLPTASRTPRAAGSR